MNHDDLATKVKFLSSLDEELQIIVVGYVRRVTSDRSL
jgi:hypothetical protein